MKSRQIELRMAALLAVIFACSAGMAIADDIVYDNTCCPVENGFLAHEGEQWGNTITLDGSSRCVTEIDFLVSHGPGDYTTLDATVSFYLPDGPSGYPGTWFYGQTMPNVMIPAHGDVPVVFVIPQVTVPDTFIFTLQFMGFSDPLHSVVMGFYDPPTVGSSLDVAWEDVGTGFVRVSFGGDPPVRFYARVLAEAAPEP